MNILLLRSAFLVSTMFVVASDIALADQSSSAKIADPAAMTGKCNIDTSRLPIAFGGVSQLVGEVITKPDGTAGVSKASVPMLVRARPTDLNGISIDPSCFSPLPPSPPLAANVEAEMSTYFADVMKSSDCRPAFILRESTFVGLSLRASYHDDATRIASLLTAQVAPYLSSVDQLLLSRAMILEAAYDDRTVSPVREIAYPMTNTGDDIENPSWRSDLVKTANSLPVINIDSVLAVVRRLHADESICLPR